MPILQMRLGEQVACWGLQSQEVDGIHAQFDFGINYY